ncbi:DUF3576 domain-containing protein [Candidatus Levibacter sp. Uisw_134_01]|uniref:DUF3576 domain-containing protein n=1 Tax=Candidatus Levibacter sp. Uisw_134_01 TaxID=3230999 RepID=UPI003D3B3B79
MIKNILLITILLLISSCSNYKSVFSNKVNGETQKPVLVLEDTSKDVLLSKIINPQNLDNVNVNGYLWRATLNILSIAPLISTDALSGKIITDWYVNKNIQNQKLKITVYINSNELKSESIKIKVEIQSFKNNIWSQPLTNKSLAAQIKDSILNEARNLKLNLDK